MKKIIGILVLLFIFPNLFATVLRFGHVTVKDGLSQSTVRCIYQDYQSYLWIGTGDGLNRFDGYQFKHYLCDPTNPGSISDYDITCIIETPADSNLWIGTRRNGLNLFNRELETFTQFVHSDTTPGAISGNQIEALLCDQNQRLWIGTTDGGLCYLNLKDTSFVAVSFDDIPAFSRINSLIEEPNGNLWVGTGNGLYRWKKADILTKNPPELLELPAYKQGSAITSLCFDFHGNLWIGSNGSGLFKYHPISGKTDRYLVQIKAPKVGSDLISDIAQTSTGKIWVATSDGLQTYNTETDSFDCYRNVPDNSESLNSDELMCLFEDKSKILWIGTFVHGLNKLDPLRMRFQNFTNLVAPNFKHPARNDIRSIARVDNTLWIGTSRGLLETSSAPEYYNFGQNTSIHLADMFISAILYNKSQGLFVCADQNIYRQSPDGQFQPLSGELQKQTGTSRWYVYSAIAGSEKNNWYATRQGLLKHNPERNTFSLKNPEDSEGNQKQEVFVSILEDYRGKLWLGSFNGSLYTYDKNTDEFTQVISNAANNQHFNFSRVFSIYESAHGMIWLGTNQGLVLYDTGKGTVKRFLYTDGLPNNIVYSVVGDNEDRIWCSTNKGISCYNPQDSSFTNFFYEDGLQNDEFNQGAYFKADNGLIYFGGIDGLNAFDPAQIKFSDFVPPVIISKIEVNYQSITPATHPAILSKQISSTQKIKLKHQQNTISFEFNALSFSLTGKIKYKYCLTRQGNKDNWIESGDRRFASFINIPPGQYTFKVQSSNSDGLWADTYTSLDIYIVPPFWSNWWFRVTLGVLLFAVVYLLMRVRYQNIRKQNLKLEQLVKSKTQKLTLQNEQIEIQNQELVNINAKLSSYNEHIRVKNEQLENQHREIVSQRNNLLKMAEQVEEANQAKIRFFTSLSHELRTPLTLIISPVKNILAQIEHISISELRRKLAIIDGNASKLLMIVNQLLDFRKIESGSMQLNISEFDLVAFVQQTAYLFNDVAKQKKYDFRFTSDFPELMIWGDIEKLEKVVFNLLSNAFKYTPEKGKIEIKLGVVSIENGRKSASLAVADSGPGIGKEKIPFIFDPFFQLNHSGYSKHSGSGLGLAITKQYVDLHKGEIKVDRSEFGGSVFTVLMPFGKNHFDENVHIIDQPALKADYLSAISREYLDTPHPDEKPEDGESPTVLLIEDDQGLRQYISEILSVHYRVETAASGENGIQLAEAKHPDLIVSDVMLPGIDGFEVCRHIKSEFNTSHIPVVLLTALADDESQFSGIQVGADAYISKPFDVKKLTLTIENLLKNRQLIRQKFATGLSFEELEMANTQDQLFLEMSRNIVEQNIDKPDFDVATLCKALGYSQPQVYRKIKALTDLSISEYIRNIRLKKAVQLLKTKKYKINQVAYEVGFSQASYFTKCFFELFGQKPSDFLK